MQTFLKTATRLTVKINIFSFVWSYAPTAITSHEFARRAKNFIKSVSVVLAKNATTQIPKSKPSYMKNCRLCRFHRIQGHREHEVLLPHMTKLPIRPKWARTSSIARRYASFTLHYVHKMERHLKNLWKVVDETESCIISLDSQFLRTIVVTFCKNSSSFLFILISVLYTTFLQVHA